MNKGTDYIFHKHIFALSVIIGLIVFAVFIVQIQNPMVFITGSGFQLNLGLFLAAFLFASFVSIKDFIYALLEKGEYKTKDWHISQKAFKLINKYIFLILSVLMLSSVVEIMYDFNDKVNELEHYIDQRDTQLEDENHVVKIYENKHYFRNKTNYFWLENTMYVNDAFTEEFLTVYDQLNRKVELDFRNFIQIDTVHFFAILNENMYYVVQTVTTLGYGDITPYYPIGMTIAWASVLAAQFITIIGVILIIRDHN